MEYDVLRECFVMKVKAEETVPAGEELTLSYGNRDNDDLLQYFGFVESANPYDKYEFQGEMDVIRVTKGSREGWKTPNIDDLALKELLNAELERLHCFMEVSPNGRDTVSKLINAFVKAKVEVLQAAMTKF